MNKRVRIIPTGKFDKFRYGSLGDGRYASLEPGVTGTLSNSRVDDMPSFVPDGLPEDCADAAWLLEKSCFEEFDGEVHPTTVFKNAPVPPMQEPVLQEDYLVLYENGTCHTFFTLKAAIAAKEYFAGKHRIFKAMTNEELKGE